MADFTRRAFLKGTAKTILTGATITAGGLSTTSTTPVKVLPAAKSIIKFKNLNVLSPKAKAYRVFLKGLIGRGTGGRFGWGDKTSLKTLLTKSGPTKIAGGEYVAYRGNTAGRQAFETATKKPVGMELYGRGRATYARSNSWVANQGIGNPAASNIAVDMRTEKRSKNRKAGAEMKTVPQVYHRGTQKLTAKLAKGARNILAGELWEYRKANPDRMFKKMSARKHSENMKTKSKGAKVGGGGKMALPGMESAKNPTGMSLITQRFTL